MDPVKGASSAQEQFERTNESLDAMLMLRIVDETPASAEESLPRDVPTDDELNKAQLPGCAGLRRS